MAISIQPIIDECRRYTDLALQSPYVQANRKISKFLRKKSQELSSSETRSDCKALGIFYQNLRIIVASRCKLSRVVGEFFVANNPVTSSYSLPPDFKIMGARDLQDSFGIECEEPPLPLNMIEILKARCLFSKEIVGKTHSLILVPEINLTQLEDLRSKRARVCPKENSFQHNKSLWSNFSKTSSGPAHWILVPDKVILDSATQTYQQQDNRLKYAGYKLPSLCEALWCAFMKEAKYIFLLPKENTFVRCKEVFCVEGVEEHVYVGMSQAKLSVGSCSLSSISSEPIYMLPIREL